MMKGDSNMRNPERLNAFYEEFYKLHKYYFPDWRFGQLISNFFGWIYSEKKRDIFFPEEDEMIALFREYCGADKDKESED